MVKELTVNFTFQEALDFLNKSKTDPESGCIVILNNGEAIVLGFKDLESDLKNNHGASMMDHDWSVIQTESVWSNFIGNKAFVPGLV